MLVIGSDLSLGTRRDILRRYVYRLTIENGYPQRNPTKAKIEATTDAQWLRDHSFYVTKAGRLDNRYNHCMPCYMADNYVLRTDTENHPAVS